MGSPRKRGPVVLGPGAVVRVTEEAVSDPQFRGAVGTVASPSVLLHGGWQVKLADRDDVVLLELWPEQLQVVVSAAQ